MPIFITICNNNLQIRCIYYLFNYKTTPNLKRQLYLTFHSLKQFVSWIVIFYFSSKIPVEDTFPQRHHYSSDEMERSQVNVVLKQNNLSLVICVAISLSLGWQKDHLSPQGEDYPSATPNEVILPHISPDESCFVFISYCLLILYHFQLRYMR